MYRGMDGRAFRARLKEVALYLPPSPLLALLALPALPALPATVAPATRATYTLPYPHAAVPFSPPSHLKVAGDAGVDVVVDMVGYPQP